MVAIEREMIRWGQSLFERHLISGWGGNLSCRLGRNEFLITGQHAPLGFLTAKDLVRVDHTGKPKRKSQRASSEAPMHMAIYAGTDASAIVHVHPPKVVAFSLAHDSFVPISFEEKYTIGEVPVIKQDTPTVTQPELVVRELKYHPIAIIKGHGTVAVGKTFQEAFLFTDLLEEAVYCQFLQSRLAPASEPAPAIASHMAPARQQMESLPLFSLEHMEALVDAANSDEQFREMGKQTQLSTSLTLLMDENSIAWTVLFSDGEITDLVAGGEGAFVISGKAEWWDAVFRARIDPFMATQQGKLKLQRGELAQLSRWYKPFQRAFALWQTIPTK